MHVDVNLPSELVLGDADEVLDLIELIAQWGIDRNITKEGGATALSQIKKLKEEVQEIEDALLADKELEVADGIGDSITVLIQIARLGGYPISDCLTGAWNEIKHRKGTMIDGVFVKEQ